MACLNSPYNTTVSGHEAAISHLQRILNNDNIFNKWLKVNVAYYSPHMQVAASDYRRLLKGIESGLPSPAVRFVSSITAIEKSSEFSPLYWVQNLVSKVNFCEALDVLAKAQRAGQGSSALQSTHTWLEIGPHSALSGSIHQTMGPTNEASPIYTYIPSLVR